MQLLGVELVQGTKQDVPLARRITRWQEADLFFPYTICEKKIDVKTILI